MVVKYISAALLVAVVIAVAVFVVLPKSTAYVNDKGISGTTGYATLAGGVCSDSDGQDSFVRGVTFSVVDKQSRSHVDYCATNSIVIEGLCKKGEMAKEQVSCAKGCVNGACTK